MRTHQRGATGLARRRPLPPAAWGTSRVQHPPPCAALATRSPGGARSCLRDETCASGRFAAHRPRFAMAIRRQPPHAREATTRWRATSSDASKQIAAGSTRSSASSRGSNASYADSRRVLTTMARSGRRKGRRYRCSIGLDALHRAVVVGTPMAELRGGIASVTLPHSGITVRFQNEQLFHVDGTPASGGSRRSSSSRPAASQPILERGTQVLAEQRLGGRGWASIDPFGPSTKR